MSIWMFIGKLLVQSLVSLVYNSQWKAFAKWANVKGANVKGTQSKDLSYVTLAE